MMRVLVCGGRDFTDYWTVNEALSVVWEYEAGRYLVVIHGAARGADELAARFCEFGSQVEEMAFPADWKRYGRAAGVIRNQQMLDEGKPDLVLAFPGGRGTADMVKRAERAGIPVRHVSLRSARSRVSHPAGKGTRSAPAASIDDARPNHPYTVDVWLVGAEPYPCVICGKQRQEHDDARPNNRKGE